MFYRTLDCIPTRQDAELPVNELLPNESFQYYPQQNDRQLSDGVSSCTNLTRPSAIPRQISSNASIEPHPVKYPNFAHNQPLSPLDSSFQVQNYDTSFANNFSIGDFPLLAEPVTEVNASNSDHFLLPAFTTVFQQRVDGSDYHTVGSEGVFQNNTIYSELVDSSQPPQYANLVTPAYASISLTSIKPSASTSQTFLPQPQPSIYGGLLSPFPAPDLYYENVQQNGTAAPLTTAPVSPVNIGHEASLFSNGFFASANRYEEEIDQQCFPHRFFTTCFRDVGVDTADLTTATSTSFELARNNVEKRKRLLIGCVPSSAVQVSVNLIPRPFKCSLCSAKFSRQWTLRQHILSHASVKMFFCPLCGKSFARRQNASGHLKTQHKVPQTARWILGCSNALYEDGGLEGKILQLDDGSYQCSSCNKTFSSDSRPDLLNAHAGTHTFTSYCCLGSRSCRKRFTSAETLLDHLNRNHPESPSITTGQLDCSQCPASFTDLAVFMKHLVEHAQSNIRRLNSSASLPRGAKSSFSKRQYKCLRCYKVFSTRLALSRHNQNDWHSYTCVAANCGRSFITRRKLELHVLNLHNGNIPAVVENTSVVCDICNKEFRTSIGLSRHASRLHGTKKQAGAVATEKQRIPCPFRDSARCGSIFDKQIQLEKHIKRYHRKRGHRKKKIQEAFVNE